MKCKYLYVAICNINHSIFNNKQQSCHFKKKKKKFAFFSFHQIKAIYFLFHTHLDFFWKFHSIFIFLIPLFLFVIVFHLRSLLYFCCGGWKEKGKQHFSLQSVFFSSLDVWIKKNVFYEKRKKKKSEMIFENYNKLWVEVANHLN